MQSLPYISQSSFVDIAHKVMHTRMSNRQNFWQSVVKHAQRRRGEIIRNPFAEMPGLTLYDLFSFMPYLLLAEYTGCFSLVIHILTGSGVLLLLRLLVFRLLTINKLGNRGRPFLAFSTSLCLVLFEDVFMERKAEGAVAKVWCSNTFCTHQTSPFPAIFHCPLSAYIHFWVLIAQNIFCL